MKELKKILVPIDFSPCSINALKIASHIANVQGAELEIIHSMSIPIELQIDVLAGPLINEASYLEQEKKIEKALKTLEKEVPELNEIPYKTIKSTTMTADLIGSSVDKDHIDLIIMGTKGSHNIVDKLLGSVSSEVIKNSIVPVLVIPEKFKKFDLDRIGLAADLRLLGDKRNLNILRLFGKMTKAEVKTFHVSDVDDLNYPKSDNESKKQKIVDALADFDHNYIWIDESQIIDGILEFVKSHELDMLVMFPRHHNFWDKIWHSSVTQKVVMEIDVPLLSIPE